MRINATDINVMSIENLKTAGSTLLFSLRRLKNSTSCSENWFIHPPANVLDPKGVSALVKMDILAKLQICVEKSCPVLVL
jgi:hypothetical protein